MVFSAKELAAKDEELGLSHINARISDMEVKLAQFDVKLSELKTELLEYEREVHAKFEALKARIEGPR